MCEARPRTTNNIEEFKKQKIKLFKKLDTLNDKIDYDNHHDIFKINKINSLINEVDKEIKTKTRRIKKSREIKKITKYLFNLMIF